MLCGQLTAWPKVPFHRGLLWHGRLYDRLRGCWYDDTYIDLWQPTTTHKDTTSWYCSNIPPDFLHLLLQAYLGSYNMDLDFGSCKLPFNYQRILLSLPGVHEVVLHERPRSSAWHVFSNAKCRQFNLPAVLPSI